MESKKLFVSAIAMAMTAAMTCSAEVNENPEMGNIRGRITDTEKQALPGATVMIEDLHTGVTSDINGYYSLPNLKPGTYKVEDYLRGVFSAGALSRKTKPIEGTVFCSNEPGFSVISASKNKLCMYMIDKKGNVLHTVSKTK